MATGTKHLDALRDQLAELRAERGLSQDDLAFAARDHGASSSLTGSNLSKVFAGSRPYSRELLEGLAGALGVSPMVFPHYRLEIWRSQFDEGQVGIDQALANLDAAAEALREHAPRLTEQLLGKQVARQSQADTGPDPAASPRARRRRSA